jgi:cysteine desulfurase
MTYLDHAATTPVLPEVIAAISQAMTLTGNASSLHTSGRAARRRIEESREAIAAALGARPSEVVFTSGGTESDNLAVAGIYRARVAADPRRHRIIAPAIEHHAVLDVIEHLVADAGAAVTWLEVDDFGRVHADTLAAAIAENPADVALVTVMWANNEVGTVNPIRELAEVAHTQGIPFHTDAVQAVGHVEVDFADVGADLLSVSAHKVGGPVGIGALLVRRGVRLRPSGFGGGQEARLRSGTVGVALAAGFAAALREAIAELPAEAVRLGALRADLLAGLVAVPGVAASVAGPVSPAIAHVVVEGTRADDVLLLLDAAGIDCSTGSACTAGVHQPSEVLLAMGRDRASASAALRFSFGPGSGPDAVAAVLAAFPEAVRRARLAA